MRRLFGAAVIIATGGRNVAAQNAAPRGTELAVGTGLTVLPDALGLQCGTSGSAGASDLGLSLLRRLGHRLAVQADTRIVNSIGFPSGCKAVLPPIDTSYVFSSTDLFATSTVRLAAELPAPGILFRLSAGPGIIWGSPKLPLGVAALAVSTRGPRARFFAEFERLQTRVDATENHHFPSGAPRSITIHPVAHTFRIGLAWGGRG